MAIFLLSILCISLALAAIMLFLMVAFLLKYNKNKNTKSIDIIVDKDSLKKIIIGKNGSMLKKVGTLAREDIESMFGKKVYLELYCKTVENWRERENYLKEFGFINKNE